MSDAEVVVAGAGPAGAATAALLAAEGVDVLLLDRARFPREKACAEFLSPGTVEALERLGVLEQAAALGAWQRGMRVVTPGADFTLAYEGGRRGLGIARTVLDSLLVEQAVAAGARLREGVTALGALENGRVRGLRVRDEDGAETRLTADVVVAADGLHSAVSRSLGVDRPPPWPRRVGLVAHARGVAASELGLMAVGRGGYCGLASLGGGETSLGMAVSPGTRRPGETAASLFGRMLDTLPALRNALAGSIPGRIRGAAPLARRVRRVAGPGYLLVGDAAGFGDPLTGEGVRRALEGAELAAHAVLEALRRPDRDPRRYAAARRRAFASKERACLALQAVLAAPPLLDHCLRRAARRPRAAEALAGIFGDYVSPETLFRPAVVADLVRP